MSKEEIIDAFLSKYYYYENFLLEPALREFTGDDEQKLEQLKDKLFAEELVEKHSSGEEGTKITVSMHARNLVNAGGYLYFYGEGERKRPSQERMPPLSYEVSGFQYYLFWPLFFIVILETAFIFWKILNF
ncbi:MAG: hypothetical protein ACOC1D_00790 [Prolixibacteraceae bacterium]